MAILINRCPISGIQSRNTTLQSKDAIGSAHTSYTSSPHPYLYLNLQSLNLVTEKLLSKTKPNQLQSQDLQAIVLSYLTHANLLQFPTKLHTLRMIDCITNLDLVVSTCNTICESYYLSDISNVILPKFATSLSPTNYGDCGGFTAYIELVTKAVKDYKVEKHDETNARKINRQGSKSLVRQSIFAKYENDLAIELNALDLVDASAVKLTSSSAVLKANLTTAEEKGYTLPSSLATSILNVLQIKSAELREYYYLMLTKSVTSLRRNRTHTFTEVDFTDLYTDVDSWDTSLNIKILILRFIDAKLRAFVTCSIDFATKSKSKSTSSKRITSAPLTAEDLAELGFLLDDSEDDTVSDDDLLTMSDEDLDNLAMGVNAKPKVKKTATKTSNALNLASLISATMPTDENLVEVAATKSSAQEILARIQAKLQSQSQTKSNVTTGSK